MIMNKEFNEDSLVIIPTSVYRKLYNLDQWDSAKKIKKLSLTGTDAVALYSFIYYTSNWQDGVTNHPKAVGSYCMRHFKWGKDRYFKAEKALKEAGLIEKVRRVDIQGKVTGWYVKIPYKANLETAKALESTVPVKGQRNKKTIVLPAHLVATNTTNTNIANKVNADNAYSFAKQDNMVEDTTGGRANLAPKLDTSKGTGTVSLFDQITLAPITEDEAQEIYNEVTSANSDFEDLLDDADIYKMQRCKTRLHYKAKGIPLKTRAQFIAAIAVYTLGGGPNRLNEALSEDYWDD
jgi:hypothetical protein